MKPIKVRRLEWEYATVSWDGSRVNAVSWDEVSAEDMQSETLDCLAHLSEARDIPLLTVLNALGQEGWELTGTLTAGGGSTLLLLKRQGVRRAAREAEVQADMARTLEQYGF